VQAAFVATDGHTIGRIFEYRTTFFALVMQAVSSDFGFLVVAHGLILYLCVKKIYVFFWVHSNTGSVMPAFEKPPQCKQAWRSINISRGRTLNTQESISY
jgi:hypothetical protein